MYYVIYDDAYNGEQIMEEILSINDAKLRVSALEVDHCVRNIQLLETHELLQLLIKRVHKLEKTIEKYKQHLAIPEDDDEDN